MGGFASLHERLNKRILYPLNYTTEISSSYNTFQEFLKSQQGKYFMKKLFRKITE